MDIEISLSGAEREYVDGRIRSGHAASAGEVLREALQLMMERDADRHSRNDAWRDRVREDIETGYREMLAGDTVDGEEFMERLRVESDARRRNVS